MVNLLFSCTKHTDTASSPLPPPSAPLPDPLWLRAQEIAVSMDDRLLAAQVLITGIDGKKFIPPHIKTMLEKIPAGGVMLFRYNLDTDNNSIRNLIFEAGSLISKTAGVFPFMATDLEGGMVNRLRDNAQLPAAGTLPAADSYWDLFLEEGQQAALDKIEEDSLQAGREIAALGFNMNFAPVAEYLNDDNRNFLRNRSYGEDPFFTTEAAAAFVRGMEQAGVLCVLKHFPGSAGTDPHYYTSIIDKDGSYLNNLVYPFAALIERNARAVMAAHTFLPAIDNKIASLSSVVMNSWLRGGLGFDGIIIADDFFMGAAGDMRPEEAAVQSVAAGADMVLVWQADLIQTHAAFICALETGALSRRRLEEAAARIIYEKLKLNYFTTNHTNDTDF